MSWPARIAALLALVLALLAVAWRVYVKADAAGYARAQSEQTAAALAVTEKRRLDERALSIKNQEVTNEYIAEKTRRAAVDAATAERLRQYQAALDSATSAAPPASSGADAPFAAIAAECAGALAKVDAHAGRLAAVAGALQDYTRRVCLAPP